MIVVSCHRLASNRRDCDHCRAHIAVTSPEEEPEPIAPQRSGRARKDDVLPLATVPGKGSSCALANVSVVCAFGNVMALCSVDNIGVAYAKM